MRGVKERKRLEANSRKATEGEEEQTKCILSGTARSLLLLPPHDRGFALELLLGLGRAHGHGLGRWRRLKVGNNERMSEKWSEKTQPETSRKRGGKKEEETLHTALGLAPEAKRLISSALVMASVCWMARESLCLHGCL